MRNRLNRVLGPVVLSQARLRMEFHTANLALDQFLLAQPIYLPQHKSIGLLGISRSKA